MAFKIISFDLDGTLVNRDFDDAVWYEEIPRLYAKRRGVSFARALRDCKAAYDEVGNKRLDWYSLDYWLKRFWFESEKARMLRDLKHLIRVFPEAKRVVRSFKRRGYLVVIVSNTSFLELKLKASGFDALVDRAFSSTTHFRTVRKSKRVFKQVCRTLKVKPSEVVHVGDYRDFDFDQPRAAGITAFLLNRKGEHKPRNAKEKFFIVRDLKEFEKRVLMLERQNRNPP